MSQVKIPAIFLFCLSLISWAINLDDIARNILWTLVAKTPSIVFISVFVFFAKYPVFIPITGILIVFLFVLLVDVGRAFVTDWSSRIEISPDIRPVTDKKDKNKFIFGPTIRNIGSTDITDFFVDLERVYWFPKEEDGKWSAGEEVIFGGRLSWLESSLQSNDCKRTIERNSTGISIRLVEQQHGKPLVIRLCDEKFILSRGKYGQLRLLIRVGGIANNWSIKPIFAMITVSQEQQLNYANLRILKKRDEFDKWNRVIDSNYLELNKPK